MERCHGVSVGMFSRPGVACIVGAEQYDCCGAPGAPAHSPTCSQEVESWWQPGPNRAQGPSYAGISLHTLGFFICASFPVHL